MGDRMARQRMKDGRSKGRVFTSGAMIISIREMLTCLAHLHGRILCFCDCPCVGAIHAGVHFFSDDIAYIKEKYRGPQYTIVDWNTGENGFYDILLMSSCRHNICANSTFSFWGARLNDSLDKVMIRSAKHKNGQKMVMMVLEEFDGESESKRIIQLRT